MKNLLILTIICLLGSSFGIAQEPVMEEAPKKKKIYFEPGINCTKFLLNFTDIKDSIQTPYALILTAGTEKVRVRTAISFQQSKDKFDEIAGFKQEVSSLVINSRLGVEFTLLRWKKLQVYGGIDGVFHHQEAITYDISAIDVISKKESDTSFGGGLATGLKFYMNNRLSISTETTFYGFRKINVAERAFQENPQFDETARDKSYTIDIDPPVSLFLNFQF